MPRNDPIHKVAEPAEGQKHSTEDEMPHPKSHRSGDANPSSNNGQQIRIDRALKQEREKSLDPLIEFRSVLFFDHGYALAVGPKAPGVRL